MTIQSYTPVSFNGTAINSGNLASGWDLNNGPLQSGQYQPVEASIVGLGDRDTRAQPAAATWVLHVKLTDGSETNVQAMYAIFNPEAGLCYVRATDGNGTTWRTQCRVLQVQQIPGTDKWFWVTLRVPDPRWQEESVSTDNKLNQTSSPISITLTNNGTRKSRPTFTITANASKSINSQVDDYAWSLRGFIVNRSPFPWVNLPVALFDASGAASRLATDTSAAGATVRQTTGATTLTADPGAAGTTLAVTSAAGFNTNGGMAIIDWVTGSTFGTMECVSYAGVSGTNLTGVVRGLGGTTAQAHAAGKAIAPCGLMPNGDDCRVWINDVEVERYLAAWNSSSSEVWTNLTMPPAVILTATSAATASVPATGGSIQFVEGVSSLPSKGFIAWGDEIIGYTGKSGKTITGIVRGVWGTTAASHAVTVPVYGNPVKYLVAAGYAKATPGQAPTQRRPAIQLDGSSPSSNQTWKWGDENSSTGDPQTIYFDRDNPDRTAQFTPGFDSDGNTVSPLMSISANKTILTFKDDVPGDGSPPYNFAEIQLPQGIKISTTAAITNDWTPAAEIINLEMFTRDQQGTLKLIDQLQQSSAAAGRTLSSSAGAPSGLSNPGFWLKLKGRYNIATGFRIVSSGSLSVANTSLSDNQDGNVAQSFRLSQDTLISKVQIKMYTSAGTQAAKFAVYRDSSDAPDGVAGPVFGAASDKTVTTTTTTIYEETTGPTLLKAGTYWLQVWRSTAASNPLNVQTHDATNVYSGIGVMKKNNTGTWAAQKRTMHFAICTAYDRSYNAPVESEQPVLTADSFPAARTATTASFDKTIVSFTTGALTTAQYGHPYVHRVTAFVSGATAGSMYHLTGTLANNTTGDSMTFDQWMKPASSIVIDCDNRTVVYTEDAIDYPRTGAITPTNLSDWMPLTAGANSLQYTDASLRSPGQLDLVSTYRGIKS